MYKRALKCHAWSTPSGGFRSCQKTLFKIEKAGKYCWLLNKFGKTRKMLKELLKIVKTISKATRHRFDLQNPNSTNTQLHVVFFLFFNTKLDL